MVHVIKSKIQPNPIECKYWIDLSEDANGGVIKYHDGNKWVNINKDSEQNHDIEQIKKDINTINSKLVVATTSKNGLMSSGDKTKVDKILTNGNGTKYLADNGQYKQISIPDVSDVVRSDDATNIMALTQSEYDGLPTKDANTLYLIKEG